MMMSNRQTVVPQELRRIANTLDVSLEAIKRAFKGDEDLLEILDTDIREKHAENMRILRNN